MRLGSLFDGSGGFPLSGALCGIEPIWASEVEPYPIAVTKSRFPNMKHLGDISKINGAEIEPVDIITFGSPCQDLSVAGKRAGLKHEDNGDDETTRSGLFIEAVRIIKEMREKTNGKYPRFAVWENVPGAFSSNKGEDFRIVLEELIKVVEPTATMPSVPQKGWNYADSYIGDGWSLAYRVLDAQYWGVPQRRRRIYLVTDFRGQRAREILFEREGLRGYFTQGRTPWQTTPTDAQGSTGADDREGEIPYTLKIRSGVTVDSHGKAAGKGALIQENLAATLGVTQDQYLFQPTGVDPYNGDTTGDKSSTLGVNCGVSTGRNAVIAIDKESYTSGVGFNRSPGITIGGPCATLQTNGVHAVCYAVENHPNDSRVKIDNEGKVQALTSRMGTGGGNVPMVMEQTPFCKSRRAQTAEDATTWKEGVVANTLNTFDQGEARANELVVETIALEGNGQRPSHQGDGYAVTDKSYTLNATEKHGVVYAVDQGGGKSQANVSEDMSPTLTCTHGGEPAVAYGIGIQSSQGIDKIGEDLSPTLINGSNPGWQNGVAIATNPILTASKASFFMSADENLADTLVATDYKDPQLVAFDTAQHKYIVRRLTPTECARLQGFADRWGDIDPKTELSDEDYKFWLEVRNTHAAINGKTTKEYTKAQMLTWYNKLPTDSAEYKMWGNGIALPTALYVIQGIAETMKGETNND